MATLVWAVLPAGGLVGWVLSSSMYRIDLLSFGCKRIFPARRQWLLPSQTLQWCLGEQSGGGHISGRRGGGITILFPYMMTLSMVDILVLYCQYDCSCGSNKSILAGNPLVMQWVSCFKYGSSIVAAFTALPLVCCSKRIVNLRWFRHLNQGVYWSISQLDRGFPHWSTCGGCSAKSKCYKTLHRMRGLNDQGHEWL